jgi:HD superfamily phosphohydrolase
MPYYEVNEKGNFVVHDPVWGAEEIGVHKEDAVLLAILHTPAMRRLMSIEQLTLPQGYETVPNTTMYKRFEHAWGSLVFVRKMIEKTPELMTLS